MRWLPLVLLASACTVAKGSGVMVSEDYDVSSSITGVGNHTFFNVTLEEGPPRATATCDDNIIDNLTFDEVQGVLELRMNPSGSYNPSSSCTVELTLSEVAVVHNNGSGNLSSPFDFAALEEVRVTGSGDVDLRGAGGDPLKTTVSGSGSLKLVGAAGEVRAKNSGSGATEIGLVGKGPGHYNLYLGAAADGSRLNKLYRENISEDAVIAELEPLLQRYAQERLEQEAFGDFLIRSQLIKAVTEGRFFHD